MKRYCFTVDDNIRFLKELTHSDAKSIFEHPYLAMYRRLHERYGAKIQLNLFYEVDGFDLSQMTSKYNDEWKSNSHWLKLSFHSRMENVYPYQYSDYDEVFTDCKSVHDEILRFASEEALGKTTTVHYCKATDEGIRALKDNGVKGLLGLYGDFNKPRHSYNNTPDECDAMRKGGGIIRDGIMYSGIDVILNNFSVDEIISELEKIKDRDFVKIMIHEQFFYEDYPHYIENYEERLKAAFEFLIGSGFHSIFFEELL